MKAAEQEATSELRRDLRADIVLELQYRNEGHLLVSYCTNLSRGGLFIASSAPLPPGTPIKIHLALPGVSISQFLSAEVRWTRYEPVSDGPPGMGLVFHNVDRFLGERIDRIVAEFVPQSIAIVSNNLGVRSHVAAQLRGLVACHTHLHLVDRDLVPELVDCDLVIIDLDHAGIEGTRLLEALDAVPVPPPWIVLHEHRAQPIHDRARRFGRLVQTPVDTEELRHAVLETLAHVRVRTR